MCSGCTFNIGPLSSPCSAPTATGIHLKHKALTCCPEGETASSSFKNIRKTSEIKKIKASESHGKGVPGQASNPHTQPWAHIRGARREPLQNPFGSHSLQHNVIFIGINRFPTVKTLATKAAGTTALSSTLPLGLCPCAHSELRGFQMRGCLARGLGLCLKQPPALQTRSLPQLDHPAVGFHSQK